MFFLSITDNRKERMAGGSVPAGAEVYRIGDFTLTVRTDGVLSFVERTGTALSVVETLCHGEAPEKCIRLAAAEYDSRLRRLEIPRSTFSGRPLYYFCDAGKFFCSTHIGLLREAGAPIAENTEALPEFFIYRFIMPPRTLYRDIYQTPAGGRLTVHCGDSGFTVERQEFAPPHSCSPGTCSPEAAAARTLDLLTSACFGLDPVKENLSLLMSGGLDSSLLFAICRNLFGTGKSLSTGYPFEHAAENIEKNYAFSAARLFGSAHEYHEPTLSEYLEGFIQAVAAAEEPVQHLQSVLLYLLFRDRIPREKKIVVCGQGADALFDAGLDGITGQPGNSSRFVRAFSRSPWLDLVRAGRKMTGRGSGILRTLLWHPDSAVPLDDPTHIAWRLDRYGDERWVTEYFGVSFRDIVLSRCRGIQSAWKRDLRDAVGIINLFGSIVETQAIWSKLGEAAGKTVVYPYSHPELIRYVSTVPWEIKLKEPKYLLRSAARTLGVPPEIISRPKSSFGIDVKRWGERGGVFEPLVPLAAKVFDEKEIRRLQSAEHSKAMAFWNILNYAIWKRICIKGERPEALAEELSGSIGTSSAALQGANA